MAYRSRWRTDVPSQPPSRVARDAPFRAARKGESYSPVEHGFGSGRHHAADTEYGLSCMGATNGPKKRIYAGGDGKIHGGIEK